MAKGKEGASKEHAGMSYYLFDTTLQSRIAIRKAMTILYIKTTLEIQTNDSAEVLQVALPHNQLQ